MLSTNFYFNTRTGKHWREPEPLRTEAEAAHMPSDTSHTWSHFLLPAPPAGVRVSILHTQELRLGEVKSSAQAHTAEPVNSRGRPGVSNHEVPSGFLVLFEASCMRITPICGAECDKKHKDWGAADGRAHCRDVFSSLPGVPQVVRHCGTLRKVPVKGEKYVPGRECRLCHYQPGRADSWKTIITKGKDRNPWLGGRWLESGEEDYELGWLRRSKGCPNQTAWFARGHFICVYYTGAVTTHISGNTLERTASTVFISQG